MASNTVNFVSYDTDDLQSNIVSGDVLKKIQGSVLGRLKDVIIPSMGPAGSNTLILKDAGVMIAEYSKDGNKIIKNVRYANPIESSIQSQIEDITSYIEHKVGDGTSSAVVLSSLIFDKLQEKITDTSNPYQIVRNFKAAVEMIKTKIMNGKKDCTLEDIYKIALISTNGNEDLADQMYSIYEKYGMDVFIDVSASLDDGTYIRDYNGLSLDSGYSDNAFINTMNGLSRLKNPRIYAFQDPIDTPALVSMFESIINSNIFSHLSNPKSMIPTVIIAPKVSRDMSGLMRVIVNYMKNYNGDAVTQKPPLLVISNIAPGVDMNHFANIANLCGCTMITKYIDHELEKSDQVAGRAPTIQNIANGFVSAEGEEPVPFYGTASYVESDTTTTKFNNPLLMYKKDDLGDVEKINGNPVPSNDYLGLISHLEAELKRAQSGGQDVYFIGSLKRQINCLKANMVEFFVGGVAIADRDSLIDLVEDAVLNCRSAAKFGVGYGANWEGFSACNVLMNANKEHELYPYFRLIYEAYNEITSIIYGTVIDDEEKLEKIIQTSKQEGPYNITTEEFDHSVLTSIMSDPTILDTIAKIITIMFTSNQALIPSPHTNMYR